MSEELHRKYRPRELEDVIGQDAAVKQLEGFFAKKKMPHQLLLTGNAGCGKTTLARIVRRRLKCHRDDYTEINAANHRGIDMIRDIAKSIRYKPLNSRGTRVWLIDESHQLTSEAQDSFLKYLEEPPDHVYFILGTTLPEKLKRTVRTRCTEVRLNAVSEENLTKLIHRVAKKEKDPIGDDIAKKIAFNALGSPRAALVTLQTVLAVDKKDRLNAVLDDELKSQGIQLCRELLKDKPTWKRVAEILQGLDEDPEQIRRLVLAYFSSIAIKPFNTGAFNRSVVVLEEFESDYFASGKAGLILSAMRALRKPE